MLSQYEKGFADKIKKLKSGLCKTSRRLFNENEIVFELEKWLKNIKEEKKCNLYSRK